MVNFGQIQRIDPLPTQISLSIGQEIIAGSLKAGDKLPTEHALAKTFGVSRSVVREAIAQLRSDGLIDTRQGVGAFVLAPAARPVIRIEPTKLANPESFRSLFQLRLPLEVEAAGLAARHHNDADLARIDATLDIMRASVTRWTDEVIAADLAFHRALAQATQNEYYLLFIGFIGEKITNSVTTTHAQTRNTLAQIVQITINEHSAVRDAVAARDVTLARAAMHTHMLGAATRLGLQLDSPTGAIDARHSHQYITGRS